MKRIIKSEGIISLEASFALLFFMMVMLLIYDFFIVFEAQYTIEHALVQASESMALETYATDKIVKTKNQQMHEYILSSGSVGAIAQEFFLVNSDNNSDYVEYSKWYEDSGKTTEVAKKRVQMYLAGGENEADSLLNVLKVENGFNGLDFTGTKVSGDDLIIQVSYKNKLVFDFPFFDKIGDVEMRISTKASMWKE